jgi:hypothetical protein
MTALQAPPYDALRQQLAETRQRLGVHVREVGTLTAPSRLVATGVESVRAAAAATVSGAMHRVADAASSTARRPRLMAALAGGAGSLAWALVARRRRRARVTPGLGRVAGVASAVLRPGSPWVGLALTAATALLRRR